MKVNFSKIVIKDIEGRDVQADFQRQLGNQLYMQGRDIEECELGKRIYFAEGDVELTDKEAAIVTELAGTTRDVLETTVPLGRVLLRLSDTAGVRESEDAIESIGITRAESIIRSADVAVFVVDLLQGVDEEDGRVLLFMCMKVMKTILLILVISLLCIVLYFKYIEQKSLIKIFGKSCSC